MLSRVTRSTSAAKTAQRALFQLSRSPVVSQSVRFQSAVTANSTTEAEKTELPTTDNQKRNRKEGERFIKRKATFIDELYDIIAKEYTEFSPFFEDVKQVLESSSPEDVRRKNRNMYGVGGKLLNKVRDIKKESNASVPNSVLNKEIISLLQANNVLHVTHSYRYVVDLINEGKYTAALTFWVDNVGYFKENPEASNMRDAAVEKSVLESYKLAGYVSYLLSLVEHNEKAIDKEFVKLIYSQNLGPKWKDLEYFVSKLSIPKEQKDAMFALLSAFQTANFDINSENSLKGIRMAAVNGKMLYLEQTIDKNLKLYENRFKDIKPSTIGHYMKYLNSAKLYSKAIDIWKLATKNEMPIDTAIWNQVLFAFSNLPLESSKNVVNSVWRLLQDSCKPDSESYSTYVRYLLKNNETDKAKEMLDDLRQNKPALFDSNLKCALIDFCLQSNRTDQAFGLFKIYIKDQTFAPSMETFNRLFASIIKNGSIEQAKSLVDVVLEPSHLELSPDIATWTSIIDVVLKSAKEAKMAKAEILENIVNIINITKQQDIKFNHVAITTVATNLLKNPQTSDLGYDLLKSMEKSGIKLTNVAYTGFISTAADQGDLETAHHYFDRALFDGIRPSATMYNSILKGYSIVPDIEATRKFMKRVQALAQENPSNKSLLPNRYTFFYLLKQGISVQDRAFIEETLSMIEKSDAQLGTSLPRILSSLDGKGYELSESLKTRIQ